MSTFETDPLVIRERLVELFRNPNLLPENFLSFLVDYLAINMPEIPIGHIIGTAAGTEVGTSFPSSPTDGQEYMYVADATNGVYWHFKYRAATSKWIFVGGAPLFSEVTTQETTASATYAALTTAGPSVALPFTADYDVQIGATIQTGAANNGASMSYDIGGTGAVDADYINIVASAGTGRGTMTRRRRKTGLTAVTLTAKYKSESGTSSFWDRNMSVWPVQK